MNARRFLFEHDFRKPPGPDADTPSAAEREAEARRAEIEAAEREAYARGLAAGREAAAAEAQQRLAAAAERIATDTADAAARIDARAAAIEEEAAAFYGALAAALAAGAIAGDPLAPIRDAAAEAFRHLRGVPHLAARVHDSLVEASEALLRDMARERGFEGRIIVLGDDTVAPGDARLDWADGGVGRDADTLLSAVADLLTRAGLPVPAALHLRTRPS